MISLLKICMVASATGLYRECTTVVIKKSSEQFQFSKKLYTSFVLMADSILSL